MEVQKIITENLEKEVVKSGITWAELSRKSGITYATICNYRAGRTSPTIENLKLLADCLEVSIFKLINQNK